MTSETIDKYDLLFNDVEGGYGRDSQLIFDFLLQFQSNNVIGDILEIGVWKGKSAGMLGIHTRDNETLMLVDIEDRFSSTLSEKLPTLNYSTHIMSSFQMSFDANLCSRSYRFIHIDARHDASYVWSELEFANEHLKETGIVCIDDFFSVAYPQVTQATYEYLAIHKHEIFMFLVGGNKAYQARPMYGRQYIDIIVDKFEDYARSNAENNIHIYRSAMWPEATCLGVQRDSRLELPAYFRLGMNSSNS